MNRANLFRPQARMDERAFEAAFYEHYPKIYGVLFRLIGDRYEADDLAAETFWRLWERPPAKENNLAGWLYRVATRLGYNALRASRRRAFYEIDAARANPPRNEDAWSPSGESDPMHEAEQRLERERVRQILRQLPEKDVQVLVLRHSGLAYKEIAEAMGVTANSVGTLLARAEQKFEALYRRSERGEKDAPKR